MRVGELKCRQSERNPLRNLHTIFLQSDAAATIYFAAHFVQLLFKGGVYFFGKPGDINYS